MKSIKLKKHEHLKPIDCDYILYTDKKNKTHITPLYDKTSKDDNGNLCLN